MNDKRSMTKDRDGWAAMYEEILSRNEQLAKEIHRLKELNPEWTADMMKALERAVMERNALRSLCGELVEGLKSIRQLDKTNEYEYGQPDRDGHKPGIGHRWKTPREITRALIPKAQSLLSGEAK